MKKKNVIGLVAGLTAGVAAAVAGGLATAKVIKEIKADLNDKEIVSPEGNNKIVLSCGVSSFAKGLALVKIKAISECKEDECKFSLIAGKSAQTVKYEWIDNNFFELTVGDGKVKQVCEVDFTEDAINIYYYVRTEEAEVPAEEIIVVAAEETESVEADEAEAVEAHAEEVAEEATDAEGEENN